MAPRPNSFPTVVAAVGAVIEYAALPTDAQAGTVPHLIATVFIRPAKPHRQRLVDDFWHPTIGTAVRPALCPRSDI